MNASLLDELARRSQVEPYGRLLGMEVIQVASGTARVRMRARSELANMFRATHGGALFSLIDEAFQLASNTHGVLAVALNVSINYIAAPEPDSLLEARAEEIHKTNRTSSYFCEIRETESGKLIASAQALAYRTSKQISSDPV
jgi:acyl-CoA thioesterase